MQITDTVLMVRPAAFTYNEQTAVTNTFQNQPTLSPAELHQKAVEQFDKVVGQLRAQDIRVLVIDDTPDPVKPDALFPNNWIVTNPNGLISLFPLQAPNRRPEKREAIIDVLREHFLVSDFHDWSEYEAEAHYLEGTGSMVMDHENKIIYACQSPRTHAVLVEKYAAANGYRALVFDAADEAGQPIYHTNVMMSIGEGFAVLCPKLITDHIERIAVAQLLEATGHENIYIEPEQMKCFAGNLLQLRNTEGARFIVLSGTALDSLPSEKIAALERYGTLLPVDVSVIEQVNGGSIRCMLAEIFLPAR
ncbi:MAG TPA: arginine deiminase-related protein [Flavisolibacter sp.]|jgi:hypothetical protein|nr:arginine deiminase-related protein [Flavisolibacter sp.]